MPQTARLKLPYPLESQANDVPLDVQKLADRIEEIEKAKIGFWYQTFARVAPERHLLMLGQTLNRTQYPDFFDRLAISGSTYILPNMQKRVPMGAIDSTQVNQLVGNANNQLVISTNQMPNHGHSYTPIPHSHGHYIPPHRHGVGGDVGNRFLVTASGTGLTLGVGGQTLAITAMDEVITDINIFPESANANIGSTGGGQPIDITPLGVLTNYVIQVM